MACRLPPVGAVRIPRSGRLIPKALHNKLERTCEGIFSVVYKRQDFLSFKTCIRGLPPSSCGGRSRIGLSSCAIAERRFPVINTAPVAADVFMNSLRSIFFNINLIPPFLMVYESQVRKTSSKIEELPWRLPICPMLYLLRADC